jgi:hypothetical protein
MALIRTPRVMAGLDPAISGKLHQILGSSPGMTIFG